MTPPISIGSQVIITGPDQIGGIDDCGTQFEVSMLWNHKRGMLYSSEDMPWYPASSLRLVPSFAKGEKVKVSLGGHLYNGYEFEIERVRDGCVEDSQGRRFRFGILLKTEEELKIGDYAEVQVNGCGVEKGTIIKISKIVEERIPGDKGPYYTADKMPLWPKHELRKLTPEEILHHAAPKIVTPKPDWDEMMIKRATEAEKRLSAIESRLKEDRNLMTEIEGRIDERVDDIEEDLDRIFKRLSVLEGEMPEVIDREQIRTPKNACVSMRSDMNGKVSIDYSDDGFELAKVVLDSMGEG